MTIKEIVRKYSNELKLVTHIPSKEVEILIMYLLDKNVIWLHLNYESQFTQEKELETLVKKRATNYPLEYIIGKASFYGEQFLVREGVLIPRPETELLVENAVTLLNDLKNANLRGEAIESHCISKMTSCNTKVSLPKEMDVLGGGTLVQNDVKAKPIKVLEIGTGSGIISVMLALLVENIKIIAVDINEKAIELAKQNAIKHNVLEKIDFRLSNLYEEVNEDDIFLTISNPPYIANSYKLPLNVKFEPSNALLGGVVGDELLKEIIKSTNDRKIPYLLCEMGYDQKKSLEDYFKNFDVKSYSFYKDYENFDRGFTLEF